MAAHKVGYVRKSVDNSIAEAVSAGALDLKAHAAPISGIRRVANAIDAQGDAVSAATLSTFLAYCKALGLVPVTRANQGRAEGGTLADMRSRSPISRNGGFRAV